MITYQTIEQPHTYTGELIKWSKFISYTIPAETQDQAKEEIKKLWKKHPQATHICYAYRVWIQLQSTMFGSYEIQAAYEYAQDDGEPAYTAGKPILRAIQWQKIYNVCIAVVRYYGGTKLWVWWLIKAYGESAKEMLEQSVVTEKNVTKTIKFMVNFSEFGTIMKWINQHNYPVQTIQHDDGVECQITIDLLQENDVKKQLERYTISYLW